MKKEVVRVFLPIYSLLENIIRSSEVLTSNTCVKLAFGLGFAFAFSFLTFVGIKKMKTSCTILFTEILLSGYIRMLEKIYSTYTKRQKVFYVFDTDSLERARGVFEKNHSMALALLLAVSYILGNISIHLTNMTRALFSTMVTLHARDNDWFREINALLDTDSTFLELASHAILFVLVFAVSGCVFRLAWAAIFSLTGSLSLLVTLEAAFNLKVGMDSLLDNKHSLFDVGPSEPAMLCILSLFFFGMVSQLVILK